MLMKLWYKFRIMNMRVDEGNGIAVVIGKGGICKDRPFSINAFLKNISCLVPVPAFGLGRSSL